ncbi:hypothetical protein BD779DRAFT_1674605 [Infundibulicybe gibba]|nr:hypothetical protein BD779DRAFT_1674605 [Infundibulicybe gibba]
MFSLTPIAKLFLASVVGVAHVIDCWKCAQGLYASLTQDTTHTELKTLRESLAAARAEVEALQEELGRAREQVAGIEKKLWDAAEEDSAPAPQVRQRQERRTTEHENKPTREELQKALERMSEDAAEVARGLRDMMGGIREDPAGAAKSLWDMVKSSALQAFASFLSLTLKSIVGVSLAAVVIFSLASLVVFSLASVIMLPLIPVILLFLAPIFSLASAVVVFLASMAKLSLTSAVGLAHVIDCWKFARYFYTYLTQDAAHTELSTSALRESLVSAHTEVEALREELGRARERIAEMEKKLQDAVEENSALALQVQQQERRAAKHETKLPREELQKALGRMREDAAEAAKSLWDMVGKNNAL